jgi:hypothetical protein
VINNDVPPPGTGRLSRHGSKSSRSRPGSTLNSPISSPREEHKGTWYVSLPLSLPQLKVEN